MGETTGQIRCRACEGHFGGVVLDLGSQPACDYFPLLDDPGPDPLYPLQMWLCDACGLAQLVADPTVPEEPRATEPAALAEQAADAVRLVSEAGWFAAGARATEYGSPHGGSWSTLLEERGLHVVSNGDQADVVLDCFGLMHCADQAAALAERVSRVARGGVLLVQYHSLATIVRRLQWNSLRHGHFAYYSTTALIGMLADVGFVPRTTWTFDLYGGTVLLAATSQAENPLPDNSVARLMAEDRALGVTDPRHVDVLHSAAATGSAALHDWLVRQQVAGRSVLGYGAASRAVSLLRLADVGSALLPAIADASPAKQGRRLPGTDIAVIPPEDLVGMAPDSVLLFLPDLLDEVRGRLPQVEMAGGSWLDVESLLASAGTRR